MAKLYFRYGAMNAGKSTMLLQIAHNYEERGQRVVVFKPALDTKGAARIVSRLGVSRQVDALLSPGDDVRTVVSALAHNVGKIACVLVDEAQFLEPHQADESLGVAIRDDIPVIAFGIRTDSATRAFPGAARLLAVAHAIEEIKTVCRCGRKAIFSARRVNGVFVRAGEQVAVDGADADVRYEALCGQCYDRLVGLSELSADEHNPR